MDIEWLRDLVIIILGIFSIILVIGLLVGLFLVYLKTRSLIKTINSYVRTVHKWLAYLRGLAKGFNESLMMFKKGGG